MQISVGVIAYNEEKNLSRLLRCLLHQDTTTITIKEIIVISDGSTDRTNRIISDYARRSNIVQPNIFVTRQGKYKRVNFFIERAKSRLLVLMSSDILLKPNTLELLCEPFKDKEVQMTTAHPIPVNGTSSVMNKIVHLNWDLHHRLSSIRPKGTELAAFRKGHIILHPTTADEEVLLANLSGKGKILYVKDAVFNNKGPDTFSEYVSQIRRNFAGHLYLKKSSQHEAITANNLTGLSHCIRELPRYGYIVFIFMLLQLLGRTLGYIDFIRGKRDVLWQMALTTKSLT